MDKIIPSVGFAPSTYDGHTNARRLNAEQLQAAREWVSECMWREDEDELASLTDRQIERGIARHFDGGIEGFLATFEVVS